MDDRWQRVNDLFHAALQHEPRSRDAFVSEACGSDTALAAAVRSLLAGYDHSSSWLQASAVLDAPAPPRPAAAWKSGQHVGAYAIERELGRGGMGVVYLAHDTHLGRKVALKALTPDCAVDEHQRERLRREACAAAALNHPGIATVYALEEHDGQLVMAREYVAGDTLRADIEAGPVPLPTVLEVGSEIARALAAAHAAGVVHRDLKPENVMRTARGVKIVDFGIARVPATAPVATTRLTDPGIVVGTPAYMAPEQLEGQEVDPRTDVFSLGVLLYELASGVHPFEGTTAVSTAARVLAADPPVLSRLNPVVPASLERVVLRCLQKRREERYQSASEVADDLDGIRREVAPASPRGRPAPRTEGVAPFTARWWWRLHQVTVMIVYGAMLLPTWKMSDWLKTPWALGLLFAMMVIAAFNGTLRLHLLFTDRFNPSSMGRQLRRTAPLLRATDCTLSIIFLAAASPIARSHLPTAGIMAAVGIVSAVVSFVVEPTTTQAAFGRRLTEPRRRTTTGQRARAKK